jgi:hypothetical protein
MMSVVLLTVSELQIILHCIVEPAGRFCMTIHRVPIGCQGHRPQDRCPGPFENILLSTRDPISADFVSQHILGPMLRLEFFDSILGMS